MAVEQLTLSKAHRKEWDWLLVCSLMAVTALGVAARFQAYVANRALWRDEGLIAANVLSRGFYELLAPLDFGQVAPVGFLVAVKAATSVFGDGERALRLVSLVAGLAALPLTFVVARAVTGSRDAWFATALVATAPSAIYFSTETKQYAADLLMSLVALWLGLWVYRSELTRRSGPALAALGALIVWFSQPVALVLAGVGLALIGHALAANRRDRALALIAVAGVWFASFLGWIWVTDATEPMLVEEREWATPGFLPFPPRSLDELAVWFKLLFLPSYTWASPVGPIEVNFLMSMLIVVVWVTGLAVLWRKDRWVFAMFLLPVGVALMASMLGAYPLLLFTRLTLFLLPLVAVPVAMALSWTCQWPGDLRVPGVGLAFAVLILPVIHSTLATVRPFPREELRTVLSYVADRHQPGDLVWLYPSARLTFHYYERLLAPEVWRQVEIVEGSARSLEAQLEELRQLAGRARVWCVFSHVHRNPIDEERLLTFMLDDVGVRLDSFHAPGASAYLYDLSSTSATFGSGVDPEGWSGGDVVEDISVYSRSFR